MTSLPPTTDPGLRPATDADGRGVAALIAAVFAEYEGCIYEPEEFPELAAVATHFRSRGGEIWVAERDGRVLACGAVAATHDPAVFSLHKFYLAWDLRGGGLGAQLLSQAVAFAKARGGRTLVLFSDTRFRRGHAFYEKHGFRRLPGVRNLNDVSASLEYFFRLELPEILPREGQVAAKRPEGEEPQSSPDSPEVRPHPSASGRHPPLRGGIS